MRRRKIFAQDLLPLAIGIGISLAASAQKPPAPPPKPKGPQPTPMDIRVAYCRPVVASTIDMHAATLARELPADLRKLSSEQHAAAIERSRRLELHFLPRINAVEPAELLDAQARGREDAVTFRKLSDACNNKCSATSGAAAASTCIQQCTAGSETAQRTRDCDDISWLPLQEGQKP